MPKSRKSITLPSAKPKAFVFARRFNKSSQDYGKDRATGRLPQTFLKRPLSPDDEAAAEPTVPPKSFEECTHLCLTRERLDVAFPFEPYPSQLRYMTQLAEALVTGRNALLESPTGTGKTLCLLSTLLAWQRAVAQGKLPNPRSALIKAISTDRNASDRNAAKKGAVEDDTEVDRGFQDLESLLDQVEPLPPLNPAAVSVPTSPATHATSPHDLSPPTKGSYVKSRRVGSVKDVPRIFYASRTHSQLAQVIGELRKSPYYNVVLNARRGFDAANAENNEPKTRKLPSTFDIEDLYRIRSTCLAARDHLCVHPEAQQRQLKGAALTSWCKKQVTKRSCVWHSGCDSQLKKGELFETQLLTTEGLKRVGLHGDAKLGLRPFCPFYASREAQRQCSLIFVPYAYVITPGMRARLKLDLKKDVVVIDEAHNLEKTAEDAVSFELSVHDVKSVIRAIENCRDVVRVEAGGATSGGAKTDDKLGADDCALLEECLGPIRALETFMCTHQLSVSPVDSRDEGLVSIFTLPDFHKRLQAMGFETIRDRRPYFRKLSLALEFAAFSDADDKSEADAHQLAALAERVEAFHGSQDTLWKPTVLSAPQKFRVVLSETEGDRKPATNKRASINVSDQWQVSQGQTFANRKLSFWAFAANVAVGDMMGERCGGGFTNCHSVIVTSGTLKPLDIQALQLGGAEIEFPIRLENSHVIKNDQLFSAVAGVGPRHSKLVMSFEALRNDRSILDEVGSVITDCAKIVRLGGILVFFPSYALLNRCLEQWTKTVTYSAISSYKEIFIEPQNADEAADAIQDFQAAVEEQVGQGPRKRRNSIKMINRPRQSTGAIFFGVCRGRISEGLSLSDDLCRLVIVVGIPYPSLGDLRLYLKRQVLSNVPIQAQNSRLDGSIWYGKQASMAVNQAAGRIVRHKEDWGALLFLDHRYTASNRQSELSQWIKENLDYRNLSSGQPWSQIAARMNDFFLQRAPMATPQPKLPDCMSNKPVGPAAPVAPVARPKLSAASGVKKSIQKSLNTRAVARTTTTQTQIPLWPAAASKKRAVTQTALPMSEILARRAAALAPESLSSGDLSKISTLADPSSPKNVSRPESPSHTSLGGDLAELGDLCELCYEKALTRTVCCNTSLCQSCCSRLSGQCSFCRKFGLKIRPMDLHSLSGTQGLPP